MCIMYTYTIHVTEVMHFTAQCRALHRMAGVSDPSVLLHTRLMSFLIGRISAGFWELVRIELGVEELEHFHQYAGVGMRLDGVERSLEQKTSGKSGAVLWGQRGGCLSLSCWFTEGTRGRST